MRIGLSCTTIEPQLTQGKIDGIGMYTRTLLEEFEKLNQTVLPFSFPKFKQLKQSGLPNGKMYPLPYTAATVAGLSQPMANLLYQNIPAQLDLLHITDHMIPRIKKVPMVATLHDALMFTHPEWYQSKLRSLKNTLRKETFKWPQHFITISHAMVGELTQYLGIKEKNISVVYNGISPWWLQPTTTLEKQSILARLKLPQQFVLFTGTLQPKKNIVRLIDAFMGLPADIRAEYPLVITGKAGWDTEEILPAIKKLCEAQAGYWLDYVTDEEIRALYQCAAVYVLPSLHEGFGRTLLEAFATKTPVIAANISALPEVAGDAAYLIDPYSVDSIKEALNKLLTSATLRQDLISKGSERIQEFSLAKCAAKTLEVYKTVI